MVGSVLRRRLRERAFGCCEVCGVVGASDAHHRALRSQGGRDVMSNLLLVCRGCHGRIHGAPAAAAARGYLVGRGVDPGLVAVLRWSRMAGGHTVCWLGDDGGVDECPHTSFSGGLDVGGVWRCDECGRVAEGRLGR